LLNPTSASGDPPTITLSLALTKLAKKKLRRNGTVRVRAKITFVPQGGLANSETANLRIKGRKK